MTASVLASPGASRFSAPSAIRLLVTLALAVWFLLVVSLGASGAFAGRAGTPPIGIAIGVAAPLGIFFLWLRLSPSFRMVLALVRQPDFAARPAFVRWNLLGVLDLLVAVSLGALSATLSTGAPGEVSTAAMASLPLLLIPAFMVPLFLMLHAVALMQGRQVARGRVSAAGR